MATIKELRQLKQQLEKAPLIFNGEIYNCYYLLGNNKLKDPNTLIDAKIALFKEAIAVWEGKPYNKQNITNLFNTFDDPNKYLQICFDNLIALKKGEALDNYYIEGYTKRRRAYPEIYDDTTQEITQLIQDKATVEAAQTKAEGEIAQYKEKLGKETPDQLKAKLEQLTKWQTAFPVEKYPKGAESAQEAEKQIREEAKAEIKKRDDEIAAKVQEITSLKEQLATKEVEAAQSNEAYLEIIKSYQELINPWLEELKSKVKSEPLTQELLSIYRKEMDYRLTLFYQEREIDNNIINEKYKQSYETILKQQLTLTNREEMEKAFKVVTCICAYEKADQMSKEKDTSSEVLLNRLDKLEKTWSPLLSLNVKSENNPFYLPLIENQSQYYGKLKELIATWKQNQLQSQQLQAGK